MPESPDALDRSPPRELTMFGVALNAAVPITGAPNALNASISVNDVAPNALNAAISANDVAPNALNASMSVSADSFTAAVVANFSAAFSAAVPITGSVAAVAMHAAHA